MGCGVTCGMWQVERLNDMKITSQNIFSMHREGDINNDELGGWI